jgi:putative membrane protein
MSVPPSGGEGSVKPEVRYQPETHFSWLRTRMSTERTLMSWVRTSTALVGFGFTIVQFFERFNQMQGVGPPISHFGARPLGLAMIAIGTFAILVALLEYHKMLRYLWSPEFHEIAGFRDRPAWTPAPLVAIMLALVGAAMLVALILRTSSGGP